MKSKTTSLGGRDDPVSERIRLVEYLISSGRLSFAESERIGSDPLLAERGTTWGTYTTLERQWDAPGFLLALEARLGYLEKTSATEVSDGSTCT